MSLDENRSTPAREKKGPTEAESNFARFIENKRILVADPSPGVRAGSFKVLRELGAKGSHIILANSYADALEALEKHRPEVILCDYNLGQQCGLRLINRQHALCEDATNRLSILVTSNGQDSTIAEAAEEDVDAYILKPFTLSNLREYLLRTAMGKTRLSPYQQALAEGRASLGLGEMEGARLMFKRAIELGEKPALAHYYYGRCCALLDRLDEAELSYREGLRINELHFRCLGGLFDLLVLQKREMAAYDIATRMMMYFPISPRRLEEILRLAVQVKVFEKIDLCIEAYSGMEHRPPELVRHMVAALTVAGIYYLANPNHNSNQPVELFQRAVILSGRNPLVFRQAIHHLLLRGRAKDAADFLKQWPAETQSDPAYLTLEYQVLNSVAPAARVVEAGRRLLGRGVEDEALYLILIDRTLEVGHKDAAEALAYDAAKRWPDSREKFLKKVVSN